jgi:hypothetical protein
MQIIALFLSFFEKVHNTNQDWTINATRQADKLNIKAMHLHKR